MSDDLVLGFNFLEQAEIPVTVYAAGETIVDVGAAATEMFLIQKGRVAIQVAGTTIEEIETGGIFGEMAMIDNSARSACVVAIEDCDIVAVDQRLFLILVQETPNFAIDVMRVLSRRLRNMNKYI